MRLIISFTFALMFIVGFSSVGYTQSASIEGKWRGGGTVTLSEGQKERVQCKVRYHKEGKRYMVNATCSVTAGTFRLSGGVVQIKGSDRYIGNLREDGGEGISLSGKIRVTVNGNKQTITAKSGLGTAIVTLNRF